jgi:hypothetical protein
VLTRTVGVINLSQFLRATLTILSLIQTSHSFAYSVTSALDISVLPRQFYLSPGIAKIAPWRLARRDNFLAKAPGRVTGQADAANVYSLNRRAVSTHSQQLTVFTTYQDVLRNRIKIIIDCSFLMQ